MATLLTWLDQVLAAECNPVRRVLIVEIQDAVFEYCPTDAPLSWHLSPNDKKEIETIWTSPTTTQQIQVVHAFLAHLPKPQTTPPPTACTAP